ncbi:MAG: immunoglobulin domain-containing protein, partial [Opitutaceae bacterium]|nr:immunoglobulin domain-containing protein [Opitutaceae bacterium]
MRIVLLGFVLLFAGVARISAAAYFVDFVGGSDANAGTQRNLAWKHCPGDPAASGMASVVALAPGDTVHFKGGVSYVLSSPTGIRLDWNGVAGAPVTYDGNSDGSWGTGRAVLTDQYGASGVTAFSSASERRHLVIRSFDFFAVGGSETVPADAGVPLAGRFGGGIALSGGATEVQIEDCVFRELGYWQSQKPMAATSLTGIGLLGSGSLQLTVRRCAFSRVATGCDFSGANSFSKVKFDQCVFGESLVWPLNLPVDFGNVALLTLDVTATSIPGPNALYGSSWTGYGRGPLTAEVSAAVGEPVVFSATALASPAASFQWYKNGVPVSGGYQARLDLGAVSAASAGTYSAIATNAAGSAVSNSIVLVVTGVPSGSIPSVPPAGSWPPATGVSVAPAITQQPLSMTVAAGGTATFTVVATGTPAPSYQWEKNGVALPGATSAALTLSGVTGNDSANYRVVVSNDAGSVTSATAALTVTVASGGNVAPTIVQQPASLTVATGGTATLAVVATGNPAPTYLWRKNGLVIAGATGPVLTLTNVTVNDIANYRVTVSNALGSVTSSLATLIVTQAESVNVAPTITQPPMSATVVAGSVVTFSVGATGTPAPTYQWEKNGVALSGATGAALTLSGVSANDSASYRVVVSNVAGTVTSANATLTVTQPAPVNVAPTITQQPASVTVEAGGTATFTVVATGSPAPTYQWRKNGLAIAGATGPVLTLTGVTANDIANYRVEVTNVAGSVTSALATLIVTQPAPVNVAPTITQPPMSATVVAGSVVTFSVVATGTPAPTYQWEKNGVALSGATGAALTLSGVSANDSASYRVVVSNVAGTVTSANATLTVIQPAPVNVVPTITQQPASVTVEAGGTATFSVVATGSPAPTYQWRKNGLAIAGATGPVLTLTGVTANDIANYRVEVTNVAGSVTSALAT